MPVRSKIGDCCGSSRVLITSWGQWKVSTMNSLGLVILRSIQLCGYAHCDCSKRTGALKKLFLGSGSNEGKMGMMD